MTRNRAPVYLAYYRDEDGPEGGEVTGVFTSVTKAKRWCLEGSERRRLSWQPITPDSATLQAEIPDEPGYSRWRVYTIERWIPR